MDLSRWNTQPTYFYVMLLIIHTRFRTLGSTSGASDTNGSNDEMIVSSDDVMNGSCNEDHQQQCYDHQRS
jgi:hypothetical protein